MVRHLHDKEGLKLREIILAPFRKQNTFNNSRKDGKCGTDVIDPIIMVTTLWASANIFHNYLMHKL